MSLNKTRPEEVPVVRMKNVYSFKASQMQRNYTSSILIQQIRDEHYHSAIMTIGHMDSTFLHLYAKSQLAVISTSHLTAKHAHQIKHKCCICQISDGFISNIYTLKCAIY